MPRSFAKTPLTISLTSGRGRLAEVKTTRRSIKELPAISAFIQARIRSPLTKCKKYRGCARRSHPRTYFCYDSKSLHLPECREIMVALLDDTLLDYRTTYPFLLVVDVALYLLLEKDYFERQIATYALPTLQESYFSTDFLLVSNLRPFNQQPRGLCALLVPTILFPCAQDCDHGAQSVSFSLSRNWVLLGRTVAFSVILSVAIIYINFLFLTFSSNYLLYVLRLFT